MKKARLKDGAVLGLSLLAVAQLAALGFRQAQGRQPVGGGLGVGDDVSEVLSRDESDRPVPLATGRPTLLLVFHSECGHCARVAPVWQDWLEDHRRDVRALAVSSESLESARAYVAEHHWGTEIRTVSAAQLGGAGHALTSRTPWLFVIDTAGVILAEGHGSRIVELGAILLAAPSATRDATRP